MTFHRITHSTPLILIPRMYHDSRFLCHLAKYHPKQSSLRIRLTRSFVACKRKTDNWFGKRTICLPPEPAVTNEDADLPVTPTWPHLRLVCCHILRRSHFHRREKVRGSLSPLCTLRLSLPFSPFPICRSLFRRVAADRNQLLSQ